ncbi:MAG: acyl-CoA thioesterase [Clostridiales bacterium]|nr:acyl-CoA thioesterase [Clostridiales bacterium]MDD6931217.1 acyl-CoA thioesterase [Eubacteriales bacterium]
MEKTSTVQDSLTRQTRMLMYQDLNTRGKLYGGRLLEWIDMVAGITGRRYCGTEVTTAAIDKLDFLTAAKLGDILEIIGKVTYVGNTSFEVKVETYVDRQNGERERINRAYLVMVALDEEERSIRPPRLVLQNDEERLEYEAAEQRYLARKKARAAAK